MPELPYRSSSRTDHGSRETIQAGRYRDHFAPSNCELIHDGGSYYPRRSQDHTEALGVIRGYNQQYSHRLEVQLDTSSALVVRKRGTMPPMTREDVYRTPETLSPPHYGPHPSYFVPNHYEYQQGKSRKRSNLPKQSTEIMKNWFDQVIQRQPARRVKSS